MKKLMSVLSLVVGMALMALSPSAGAQTVVLKGLGSSALFLQAGFGASQMGGAINATCLWTGAGGVATDTSVTPAATDSCNSWVAWEPSTGGCASPTTTVKVYPTCRLHHTLAKHSAEDAASSSRLLHSQPTE